MVRAQSLTADTLHIISFRLAQTVRRLKVLREQ